MKKRCFKCGEEKEEEEITLEYGKPICRECFKSFGKESKKELDNAIENLF